MAQHEKPLEKENDERKNRSDAGIAIPTEGPIFSCTGISKRLTFIMWGGGTLSHAMQVPNNLFDTALVMTNT